GFVTDHLDDAMLNKGDVDIYFCGRPPMVNAVATALRDRGLTPAGFWSEQFIASQRAAA
ncbi:NADH oxidase, partial [Klebsiella pneumoniae]|nr:NADH oxidase [Klebsiella pneumoniae]